MPALFSTAHNTAAHTWNHCRHTRPHVTPRVAHTSRKQQNYAHQLGWWWGSNFLRWTEYPQDTSSGGVNPPPGPWGVQRNLKVTFEHFSSEHRLKSINWKSD